MWFVGNATIARYCAILSSISVIALALAGCGGGASTALSPGGDTLGRLQGISLLAGDQISGVEAGDASVGAEAAAVAAPSASVEATSLTRATQPIGIRYFIELPERPGQVYELIDGFRPAAKIVAKAGLGSIVLPDGRRLPVTGQGDRAPRNSVIYTAVSGSGAATATILKNFTQPVIGPIPLTLPSLVPQKVSATLDNIVVRITQSGRNVERRVAIGLISL